MTQRIAPRPRRVLPIALLLLALPAAVPAIVVTAGMTGEPSTLDPAQAWDSASSPIIGNIFETLVRLHPRTLAIEPWLAESWEARDGGRSWLLRLRPGVRFHDGTPCDAAAVVFSFRRQLDPRSPHRHYEMPMFAEIFTPLRAVSEVDPRTVRFELREPFAPFLATLASDCAAIVSPQAVRRHGPDFAFRPCGSGPFRLGRWLRGKRIELQANPGYWRGRPAIDGFSVHFDPHQERLSNLFREGRLDMLLSISISRIAALKRSRSVRILSAATLSTEFLVINASAPPLNRRGLRQALKLMWDARPLKLVYQDTMQPATALMPRGMPGGAPAAAVSASPDQARARLAADGLRPPIPLEYLLHESDSLDAQMMSLFAQNLQRIGIQMRLVRVGDAEYSRRIAAGRFQMARSGWIADYPDPDSMFYPLFSASLQRQGFANLAGMRTPAVADLLAAGRHSLSETARSGAYQRLQRLIDEEAWLVPIGTGLIVIPYNARLQGMAVDPLGRLRLEDVSAR